MVKKGVFALIWESIQPSSGWSKSKNPRKGSLVRAYREGRNTRLLKEGRELALKL